MIIDNLLPQTGVTPDAEAVKAENGSLTWQQVERRGCSVARALRAEGLAPGDRWALLSGNRLEWIEMVLGNGRAGTHYVPLNWHLTAPELAYLLEDSGARLLVVERAFEEAGRAAAASAGVDRVILLGPEYDDWVDAQPSDPTENGPAGNPLVYTGGTTGRSKGVLRSDRAATVDVWAARSAAWGGFVHVPEQGTSLMTTPLYHSFGGGALVAGMARGNRTVLESRFDPERFLQLVEAERVTTAPLVPTQIVRLVKLAEEVRATYDVSSLEHLYHTAAPCPAWAKQALIDWVGPIVVEFYGSSEGTGPVVCTSQEWMDRPGTVGRPNPTLTASVVGDGGEDLANGEIGTLYFARAEGAPTYHGDPEKTESMRLPDGRFTVGDVGWMDDEGFVYLADRRVDLILSGGVNIYPAEIEAVLIEHPAVRDTAVFGIPDADWGQQVKAVVELEPGAAATKADLLTWCRSHLASFKCPKSVDFADAMPREASGKLKKRVLRDVYWDQAQPRPS